MGETQPDWGDDAPLGQFAIKTGSAMIYTGKTIRELRSSRPTAQRSSGVTNL